MSRCQNALILTGSSSRLLKSARLSDSLGTPPCNTIYRAFNNQRPNSNGRIAREADKLAEYTRDEQIDTKMVQLKSDGGGLAQPQPLRWILGEIDRNSHCVVQLSKPGEREAAVVEVKAKMDLLRQIRDKENQIRQQELAKRDKKPKQIELNWAISENDLNLKLKQMEGFLEKGKTVEFILAAKKRQRKATEEEGTKLLNKIRQTLEDIGAKEAKPMQGEVLKQAVMVLKK